MLLLFFLLMAVTFSAYNLSLVPIYSFSDNIVDISPTGDGFYALAPQMLYIYSLDHVSESIPITTRQAYEMAAWDSYVVYTTKINVYSILPGINSLNLSLYGVKAFEGEDNFLYACMSYWSINKYKWWKDEYGDFNYSFVSSLPMEFNCSDIALSEDEVYIAGEKTVIAAKEDLSPIVVCNITSYSIWPVNSSLFLISNGGGVILLNRSCVPLAAVNISGKVRYPYLLSGSTVYRIKVLELPEFQQAINETNETKKEKPLKEEGVKNESMVAEEKEEKSEKKPEPICTLPVLISLLLLWPKK